METGFADSEKASKAKNRPVDWERISCEETRFSFEVESLSDDDRGEF